MKLENIEAARLLEGHHPSTSRAAGWIREHFLVPNDQTVVELFEQVFDCQIIMDDRTDAWMWPEFVLFKTEADKMFFVLKWS